MIALAAPIVLLGLFVASYAMVTAAPANSTSNPLAGVTFYNNPKSTANVAAAAAAESDPGAADTATLESLAEQPSAIWLLPEKFPADTVEADVAAIADAAAEAGQMPVFVIYGIPDRDCKQYSAGGLPPGEYEAWVSSIASALTTRPSVGIGEPDALALAQECGNVEERVSQIKQDVATLSGTIATV
jgi:endoglucanase